LTRHADRLGVRCDQQYLRREGAGAGVCSQELPWVAMNTKDRIGALKQMWQRADKAYRTSGTAEYEHEATLVYGRLREAWERASEEVLLGGVVERYRPSVETMRARYLCVIP